MTLHARGLHGLSAIGHGRETSGPLVSRHTVSLDALTGTVTDVLLTARILLTDIVQAFGLPEVGEITPSGALRIRHFWDRQQIQPWAENHDVVVVEEYLHPPVP
jgi:hypothetical protein